MRLSGLISLFLIALLSSCVRPPERPDHLVFRYNEAAGISSLDPAFARNQANIWAVNQMFDGLVAMNNDLQVIPALAERWSVSDSGRLYIFTLRDSVYFHRAPCFKSEAERLVEAADVVFSLERLRNPQLAAPGAWTLSKVDSIFAPDSKTVGIRLTDPFPPFLSVLTMQYCSVLPREAIEYYGADFRAQPVGTGPFRFQYWLENEKLILRRNPRYYQRDSSGSRLPYLEAVAISFVPDKQAAFLEFLKGNIDFISGLDASYKDEILNYEGALRKKYRAEFAVYRQPYLNTEYLGFLVDSSASVTEGNPVLNKAYRQALNYCFDRRAMIRYLRNNIGTPAMAGMIPKGLPAFDTAEVPGYRYNPAKAKELLAQAGFPQGEGLPELTLQTNSSYLDLCEYLQSEALKVGIPLRVEVTPPATLRQGMATAKVPFFRGSWIADYPDAENYLSLFYSKNWTPEGPNYTRFANPLFDEWYEQAISTTNDSLRIRLYQRMDSLVISEAPVIPLYYDQVLRFYRKGTKGLGGNALNLLDLTRVRKSRE